MKFEDQNNFSIQSNHKNHLSSMIGEEITSLEITALQKIAMRAKKT